MNGPGVFEFSADRPFVGLRSYGYADHAHFFGRDDQIFSLYRLLDRSPFIAVIGSSGSGKSSLVSAGLLPLLHEESEGAGGREWRWIQMHPGNAPLAQLADALARSSVTADDSIAADRHERIVFALRRSRFGLSDALAATGIPATASLVLMVDQFEELFRYAGNGVHDAQRVQDDASSREEAAHFVQLLLEASRSRRVHVLITMRSDFIGDCARFQGLPEAVSATQFLVPSLTRDQLEEVIRKPIDKAQSTIESDLVERLLNECGSEFDQLPVLQHCLMRLWDRAGRLLPSGSARRHLTGDHYRDIRGFSGALSEHADEILGGLKGPERAVEQVFRALAETDKEGRVTRRAIEYQQLQRETGEPDDDVRQVVDRFRANDCSFLLPSPVEQPTLAPGTLIDVGHEALLRRWNRVSSETAAGRTGWLRDEEADAQRYRVLLATAENGTLIPIQEVESRETWWKERTRTKEWGARYGGQFERVQKLLADSRAALEAHRARLQREAADEAERQRAREQQDIEIAAARERERGSRRLAYVAAALAAVVLAFLFTALWLAGRADNQRDIAKKQSLIADQQREIANTAMDASLKFVGNLLNQISSQTQDGSLPTAAARQLLTTAEEIFKSVPDTERTLATRVQLLASFVDVYLELQDFQRARTYAEQARSDAEKLVARNPADDEWQLLLYGAAYRIGDRLVFIDTDRALREYELADSIVRKLAERSQGSARWQEARTFVLLKIGDIKLINRNYPDALKSYRLALDIASKLAAGKGIHESLRHVANAHMRIGDLFVQQGQWKEAYEEFQAGLKIREDLVRQFPNNISRSNLSVAYNRMGLFLRESKKFDEALEFYRKAFDIRSQLAKGDPNNNAMQSFLAFQHTYIGDVLAMTGDVAAALKDYGEALPLRQVLVGKDPRNVTWVRNLADLHEKVGKLLVSVKSREGLGHFEAALKYRVELSQRFPDSSARQRELFDVNLAIGDFYRSQGESSQALAHFEAALKVADAYLARDPNDKAWQGRRASAQARMEAAKQAPQ